MIKKMMKSTNSLIEYIKIPISDDERIQKLSVRIGRLENKSIIRLIDKIGIDGILEQQLSIKDLDIYYKSKYKLFTLLNK